MAITATTRGHDAAAPQASPRSEIYALLASAFSFPEASLHVRAREGRLAERIAAALAGLPYRLSTAGLNWRVPDTYDEMQSEYIRLFQVGGRRGPPCPLHAGHYSRDRGSTLQNLIRFYNYFGYRVTERVMPDQLAVQLEFMSELASGAVSDEASALNAQRDFLGRHLAWTETLAARVAGAAPDPFYRSLTALTARLVAADRRFIRSALGGEGNAAS